MAIRLADAISPYLRSHAGNPVDWWPWGEAAFAEAARRDVPVFVSIGYATCHWCHVMARESFSDPIVGAYMNDNFVSIKVDREEHPDVDAAYMAAAGAFTRNLGWPLNVITTPEGAPFFAGSYFPPRPGRGLPEFLSVLGAVVDAWANRREQVDAGAVALRQVLSEASAKALSTHAGTGTVLMLPDSRTLAAAIEELLTLEDEPYGGFGTAPKFPMAPLLCFLIESPGRGSELGLRTLKRMGASPLRDSVEGGFFRYSTGRDWSDPHYERMLVDNALLFDDATAAWLLAPSRNHWALGLMSGVAGFLGSVMWQDGQGFASAQDSESELNGQRSEGGYYRLTADDRAVVQAPALDEKVLAGWNGLAIGALARAGAASAREDWVRLAQKAADAVLGSHLDANSGLLKRVALGGRISEAPATLEDYGMLATGLLQLAISRGEAVYAVHARALVDATLRAAVEATSPTPFDVPGGAERTLAAQGMALTLDVSEGSSPSGYTAIARGSYELYLLGAGDNYRVVAEAMGAIMAPAALERPIAYGGVLGLLQRLTRPVVQLVTVVPDSLDTQDATLLTATRTAPTSLTAIVSEAQARAFAGAGFELFESRVSQDGRAAAYLCRDFACRLPTVEAATLVEQLSE